MIFWLAQRLLYWTGPLGSRRETSRGKIMRIYTATVIPGASDKDVIRIPEPRGPISEPSGLSETGFAEGSLPDADPYAPDQAWTDLAEDLTGPEGDRTMMAAGPWERNGGRLDERRDGDLCDITARYDVRTMTGTDVVNFANELIATGVDQTDALAVTWPINCRNLMQKVGKDAAAPKIESWDDVVRLHRARRDLAERRAQHNHGEHLDRLIALAETLHLAASDYDWSGPGH